MQRARGDAWRCARRSASRSRRRMARARAVDSASRGWRSRRAAGRGGPGRKRIPISRAGWSMRTPSAARVRSRRWSSAAEQGGTVSASEPARIASAEARRSPTPMAARTRRGSGSPRAGRSREGAGDVVARDRAAARASGCPGRQATTLRPGRMGVSVRFSGTAAASMGWMARSSTPPRREGIAWMASPEAMRAHVRSGFPVAPRFSVGTDPAVMISSPIASLVDRRAQRNSLRTWGRPAIPRYAGIGRLLGEEIREAVFGDDPPRPRASPGAGEGGDRLRQASNAPMHSRADAANRRGRPVGGRVRAGPSRRPRSTPRWASPSWSPSRRGPATRTTAT